MGQDILVRINGDSSNYERATKRAIAISDGFASKINGMLATVGVGVGVAGLIQLSKTLIDISDQYTNLDGRLRLVSKSSDDFAAAQKGLYDIAKETRVEYGATVDLYTRMARSTDQLGLSQNDLLQITGNINKALIVSGASGESAAAALMQLGQGMASGTLRGEELNSVLEQTPRLAQMIADGMGITIGQLREYGKEGKLTAEAVTKALLSQSQAINEEFGKMPETVGQAMTNLKTAFGTTVSEINEVTGGTLSLAGAIESLATAIEDNKDDIATGFSEIGKAISKAVEWYKVYSDFVDKVDAKIQNNLWQSPAVLESERNAAKRGDPGASVADETMMQQAIAARAAASNSRTQPKPTVTGLTDAEKKKLAERVEKLRESLMTETELENKHYHESLALAGKDSVLRQKVIADHLKKLDEIAGKKDVEKIRLDLLTPQEKEIEDYTEKVKKIKEFYKLKPELSAEQNALLEKLAIDHEKNMDEITGKDKLKEKLKDLEDSFKTERELEQARYEEKKKDLQEFYDNDLIPDLEKYADLQAQIEFEHQQKLTEITKKGLTERQKFQAMSLQAQAKDVFGELANVTSGVAQHNKTMFAMNKAAGIANAVINTYEGVSKTLAKYPYPIAIPLAAAHLTAGLAQVSAITNTSFNGGGAGSAPSVAGTTASTPVTDVQNSQMSVANTRTITIYGLNKNDLFTGKQVAELLNDYMADGGKLVIK